MTTRRALYLVIGIIVLSPLVYYSTGIGQSASSLRAELVVLADNTLESSPKAVALHRLTLPIRIENLLVYPLFLFLLQYSGAAVKLRKTVSESWMATFTDKRPFAALDRILDRFTKQRLSFAQLAEVILFVALITLLISLVYAPFTYYREFVLLHQFGLSTQSLGAWFRDFLVNEIVTILITLAVYGGFYILLKLIPHSWPIWLGAGYAVSYFIFILLVPLIITPLFYEVTPVTDPDLKAQIFTLTQRAGLAVDDISVIDASSKTTTVNAYFTGFGEARKVVLWDTLLAKHMPEEVDVVIAHEMGHWFYRHVLLGSTLSVAGTWLGLFVLRFWFNRVWRKLNWRGPDDVAGYPYLLAIVALAGVLTLPAANTLSRFGEGQADRFAIEISQSPEVAVHLFERLAQENLSMIRVPDWEKILFYSHPPLNERIESARQAMETVQ